MHLKKERKFKRGSVTPHKIQNTPVILNLGYLKFPVSRPGNRFSLIFSLFCSHFRMPIANAVNANALQPQTSVKFWWPALRLRICNDYVTDGILSVRQLEAMLHNLNFCNKICTDVRFYFFFKPNTELFILTVLFHFFLKHEMHT